MRLSAPLVKRGRTNVGSGLQLRLLKPLLSRPPRPFLLRSRLYGVCRYSLLHCRLHRWLHSWLLVSLLRVGWLLNSRLHS